MDRPLFGRSQKKRDWITNSQFQRRSGLSDKTVSQAIDSLIEKQLIKVTDSNGNVLYTPSQRRGKVQLFYEPFFKKTVKTP